MKELIKPFENAFLQGFALHNNYESLSEIKAKIESEIYQLTKINDNFFITQKHMNLLTFFVNEPEKDFKFKDKFVKIIAKKESDFAKFTPFFTTNHFKEFEIYQQMRLEAGKFSLEKARNFLKDFTLLSLAKADEIELLEEFLTRFFSPKYLFYFSDEELKSKAKSGEIMLYKESVQDLKTQIKGALIFSKSLNSAMLDFIAVDSNLTHKNAAFALLSAFCAMNESAKFYQLFVRVDNQKAINFYQKSGFEFKNVSLKFYKNEV